MSIIKNKVNNPERSNPIPKDQLLDKCQNIFSILKGDSLKGDKAPTSVLGQLMRSENVASSFLTYWAESKITMSLSLRQQELIILRSACIFGCEYVWGHHVPVAQQEGLKDDDIMQITQEIASISLPEEDKILLEFTDQIYKKANITDILWNQVNRYYTEIQILDMITVTSQYLLFNSVNNIFGIKLENNTMPPLGMIIEDTNEI